MRTNQYLADSQSIGDWGGNEEQAIDLWNTHIAPVLREAHEARENSPEYSGESEFEDLSYDADWAWNEFCGRAAGDDETAAAALGAELRARMQ